MHAGWSAAAFGGACPDPVGEAAGFDFFLLPLIFLFETVFVQAPRASRCSSVTWSGGWQVIIKVKSRRLDALRAQENGNL